MTGSILAARGSWSEVMDWNVRRQKLRFFGLPSSCIQAGSIYFEFSDQYKLRVNGQFAWKRAAGGEIVSLSATEMTRFRLVYSSKHMVSVITLQGSGFN